MVDPLSLDPPYSHYIKIAWMGVSFGKGDFIEDDFIKGGLKNPP